MQGPRPLHHSQRQRAVSRLGESLVQNPRPSPLPLARPRVTGDVRAGFIRYSPSRLLGFARAPVAANVRSERWRSSCAHPAVLGNSPSGSHPFETRSILLCPTPLETCAGMESTGRRHANSSLCHSLPRPGSGDARAITKKGQSGDEPNTSWGDFEAQRAVSACLGLGEPQVVPHQP